LSSITRVAALAALITAFGTTSAQAFTIGDIPSSGTSSNSCSGFTVWQFVPSTAQDTATIVTSWKTYQRAGSAGRTLRLKVLRPAGDHAWQVVGEAPEFDVGTDEGVKTQDVSLTIAPGDFVALFGNGADCYFMDGSTRQLDGNPGPEPAVGDTIGDGAGPSPAGLVLDAQLIAEADADGDGFGDETQDTCPAEAAIHAGPCQADLGLSATVTPSTIGVGDIAVITGTVSNAGPSPATDVVLHTAVGPGLQVVSSLPSAGCAFTTDLACPVGTLGKDGSVPFYAVVKGTKTGVTSLSASVAGSTTDAKPVNNAAGGSITVEQRVPLVCTVPSVKGLTKSVAKRLLAAVHCKLGKATKKKSKKGKRRTVIRQAKKAGTVLPAGSKVNVTLKK